MAKVMLIEHDETGKHYQDLLTKTMKEHSFYLCRSIAEAKRIINNSFSVVIFDQRLENGELGTDFMRWCKQNHPHIVGVMLSALVTRDDLASAYRDHLIVTYLKKNKEDLMKLPEVVSDAISKSEVELITNNYINNSHPILIGKIRTPNRLFSSIKVYKVGETIVTSDFIDDSLWESTRVLHAGQTTSNKIVYTKTTKVSIKCETQFVFGINTEKLNSIITQSLKLDANMLLSLNSESSESVQSEMVDSFEMPEQPNDPNDVHLSSILFQTNQVFELRSAIIKLVCPVCKDEKYVTAEMRIPTNREKHRKIMVYSDGSKKILDV